MTFKGAKLLRNTQGTKNMVVLMEMAKMRPFGAELTRYTVN